MLRDYIEAILHCYDLESEARIKSQGIYSRILSFESINAIQPNLFRLKYVSTSASLPEQVDAPVLSYGMPTHRKD